MFTAANRRVMRCGGCRLVTAKGAIASEQLHTYWGGTETECDAAERYANLISECCSEQAKVLVVASEPHPIGNALRSRGFAPEFADVRSFLQHRQHYGCIIFLFSLEKFTDLDAAMAHSRELLTADGALFIATPSVDSRAAKFFKKNWVHWNSGSYSYFSRPTIQLLLQKHGFGNIWFQPDKRLMTPEHVGEKLLRSGAGFAARSVGTFVKMLPRRVLTDDLRLETSGLLVTALRLQERNETVLSIIMPVFNERSTVETTLNQVLAKTVDGIDRREIIVVESNSTDGSRELLKKYEDHPDVQVIYQEKPKGKGNAVRTGFEHARGDIILIQDADTEYDVNDYDELVTPLLKNHDLFVLGSRHQGDWKMRKFTDNPLLAVVMNFGQIVFTWLMNTLYQQRMTDPFTMYKVFRRECLFGLKWECNRFDFDHELVIKLLLKGYTPFEIPVNYASRSYSEGKKVTIFGDPLTWIKANFKFRFATPYTPIRQAYTKALAERRMALNARNRRRAIFISGDKAE